MRKRFLYLSLAAVAVLIFGFAPRAAAACVACSNWGGSCVSCEDDLRCAAVNESANCTCRQFGEGCIAWTYCAYTSCTIADGGRLACPLQPIRSIPVPKYPKKAAQAPRAADAPKATRAS